MLSEIDPESIFLFILKQPVGILQAQLCSGAPLVPRPLRFPTPVPVFAFPDANPAQRFAEERRNDGACERCPKGDANLSAVDSDEAQPIPRRLS